MVRLLQWEQVDPKAPVPETDYSVSVSNSTIDLTCGIFRLLSLVLMSPNRSDWRRADLFSHSPCSLDRCILLPYAGDIVAKTSNFSWSRLYLYHRPGTRDRESDAKRKIMEGRSPYTR